MGTLITDQSQKTCHRLLITHQIWNTISDKIYESVCIRATINHDKVNGVSLYGSVGPKKEDNVIKNGSNVVFSIGLLLTLLLIALIVCHWFKQGTWRCRTYFSIKTSHRLTTESTSSTIKHFKALMLNSLFAKRWFFYFQHIFLLLIVLVVFIYSVYTLQWALSH